MRRFTLLTVLIFCFVPSVIFSDAYYPEMPPPKEAEPAPPPLIITAVLEGDTALVRKLITQDAKTLHAEDASGRTPLHYAAYQGSEELANLLLRNGADASRTDHAGALPIHAALQHGGVFARKFSGSGSLLYVQDNQGMSAFSSAASEGAEAVKALLGREYLDFPDNEGNTPLHYGAMLGDAAMVSRLIADGAHVNSRNQEGLLPLDIALSYTHSRDHAETAELLITSYSDAPKHEAFTYAYRSILSGDLYMRFTNQTSVLHLAASRDHYALLSLFIDRNASLDLRDIDGNAPLHSASASGYAHMVSILISNGSSLDAVNTLLQTPLHLAVLNDVPEIAAMLLDAGACADAADLEGRTPLYLAAGKSAEMADILLDMGADVNRQDHAGSTPLMAAVDSRNEATVRLLLDHGADMHRKNLDLVTPLHRALLAGKTPASWLVHSGTIEDVDDLGNTALHIAVQIGSTIEVLQHCLISGIAIEAKNVYGNTPLHDAMASPSTAAAVYLLGEGADFFAVNAMEITPVDILFSRGTEVIRQVLDTSLIARSDEHGNTLLHAASRNNLHDIASLLLSLGADPNTLNREGYAPVHYAVRLDSIPLLQALTRHHADLNLPSGKSADTAVHTAAAYGSSRALRFLLLAGAYVHRVNAAGYAPMHIAVMHQDDISVRTLHEFGATLEQRDPSGLTPLHIAVRKQNYAMTDLLIRFGSDVLTRDNMGSTPLHDCVKGKNGNIGSILTAAGADIHAENRFEESPLTLAFLAGADTVRWLLDGPAALSRDNSGNTALHLAVKHMAPIEVLQAIMETRSDVHSRNNRLETPLHTALQVQHYAAARFLVNAGADIFAPNGEREYPLASAMRLGPEALSWIMTPDTVNATDSQGNTPLHAAVKAGSVESVSFLLEAGADPTMKNHEGILPEESARAMERSDILEMF